MPGGLLGCVIVFLYSERIQTQFGSSGLGTPNLKFQLTIGQGFAGSVWISLSCEELLEK